MRFQNGKLRFSPSDLTNFMESRFVSFMDRLLATGDARALQDAPDESMDIIRERGLAHEKEYLAMLHASGADVVEIDDSQGNGLELTKQAIREGRQCIYQAHLADGEFFGKSDFLLRVDGTSGSLGNCLYEPLDTKLALKPKPYFAIQLCCYAEMLAGLQGSLPESFNIVLGDRTTRSFRTEDYYYFYRQLKDQFLEYHQNFDGSEFPEYIDLPAFCAWHDLGEKIMEERDDLFRVANIRKSQVIKLKKAGIGSLTALADSKVEKVPRMSDETFSTLKHQSSLQVRSKDLEKPLFEILPPQTDSSRRGFALLPPPSKNDVWFDMEGYPHAEGGLEYLFGATHVENGSIEFFERWAHDETQEQRAFEEFVDWIFQRFEEDPTMHVYHYAAYEQTALRRLMGKFGSRETEIDLLLRHNVFIDLYTVVRQSIRVGEPRYSIKNVEHLYRDRRDGEVSTAMDSVISYYQWLECRDGDDPQSSKILASIRQYNKEDCESTYQLCNWLRDLQGLDSTRAYIKPPDPAESEDAPDDEVSLLADQVLSIHGDGQIPTVLSQLLFFHKREEKPVWWAIFDKRSWTSDQLYDDLESLAGLHGTERFGEPSGTKSKLYEFRFDPDQETKIDAGDTVCFYLGDGSFSTMSVKEFDADQGLIALSSTKTIPPINLDIVKKDLTGIPTIRKSIFNLVSAYCAGTPLPAAISQFLERGAPRIRDHADGQAIIANTDQPLLPQVIDVIKRLDDSTLCVQGPPGCGKTYTSAHAIVALLADGKRVGVTSNSHKAIELLLNTIGEAALTQGRDLSGAKIGMDSKDSAPPTFCHPGIVHKSDAGKAFGSFDLIGGTAYAFSRDEAAGSVDYLFVDEAGQVCIANLVGMCRSAKNIILLGDQMQLNQPIRGSHPGDSGLSTLQYYLEDYSAAPADMGVFLSMTRRLPPDLCQFISSAIYSGRLTHSASTDDRKLILSNKQEIQRDSGLLFVPVQHQGCVQSSDEEVERIQHLITELKDCQVSIDGNVVPFVAEDHLLIVSPYNKQVRLLKQSLPGIEIGTVDKFQGKEKPVVVVSMTESDLTESARGVEFLFSKNRLNVALSRAQVLAIVVGNPSLSYVDCGSLKTMSLVNLFSRVMQYGSPEIEPQKQFAQTSLSMMATNEPKEAPEVVNLPLMVSEPTAAYIVTQRTKLGGLIDSLGIPAEIRLDQRVPKKLLMEQGAKTAADRRQIQEGIEDLVWVAALKPTNIGVPAFKDDVRDYLEIVVLSVILRGSVKPARLSELIHRAVPYPLVLFARHGESASISFAHKRVSQAQAGRVVIEDVRRVEILRPDSPDDRESRFLSGLSLSKLPTANLFAMYEGLFATALAFEASAITGNFLLPSDQQTANELKNNLDNYARLKSDLSSLRRQAAKEKQLNKRVQLNVEIKRLEAQLAVISAGLARETAE